MIAGELTTEQQTKLIAGFAALAVCIHIVESSVPSPIPGIKPGLANVITLIVLLRYGPRMAAWVAAMRVIAGSLLIGSFLTPTFIMSAGGAIASVSVLLSLWWMNGRLERLAPRLALGAVGLSLAAAWAHMSGQLIIARLLFIPHNGLFSLAPVLLTAATVFGIVSGLFAVALLRKLAPISELQ
jgi:heptaprenyl diphosphate synthase